MKKNWVGNRRKKFYSDIWGNAVWGGMGGGGGACQKPVALTPPPPPPPPPLAKIRWDSPCMIVLWKLLNTCGWIFGACWIRLLDFVTKLQKYTSLAYSRWTSEKCIKWDIVVVGRDKLCENSNPLQGLTFNGPTWWNEDLYTQSITENECWSDCKKIRMLDPNLTTCQLAAWAENAV